MAHQKRISTRNDLLTSLKSGIEKISDAEHRNTSECMVVVISALKVGADVDRLIEYTGYSKDFVESISRRMRAAGLWIDELVDDREWRDSGKELLADVFRHALVAKGTLIREITENGGCIYFDSETREIWAEWCPPATRVNLA